jgi:hypothetical protein
MAQVVTLLTCIPEKPDYNLGLNNVFSLISSVPPGEYQDSVFRQAITTSLKLFQIHQKRSCLKIRAEMAAGLRTASRVNQNPHLPT